MDSSRTAGVMAPVPRPRTPADVWFGLLRRLGRGLGDRRLAVRGASFRLEELDFRSGGSAWSFGRVRDVRAVATDIELDDVPGLEDLEGVRCERIVAECDAVSFGAVATASAITLTATLSPETVQTLLDRSGAPVRLVFADGELRVPWLPGTDLVVEPEVADDGAIDMRTVAVRSLGQKLGLPAWLPTTTTVRPTLPAGLRLIGVWRQGEEPTGASEATGRGLGATGEVAGVAGDGVVVRAVLDDPPPTGLERRHVRELVAASRR